MGPQFVQGNYTKIPSAHISTSYWYFAHSIHLVSHPNFAKTTNLSCMVSLSGATPGVDSCSRHFGAINK